MESYENSRNLILSDDNKRRLQNIGLALSNEKRIDMLSAIHDGINSVTTLAKKLNIPNSNVIFHAKILEEAGLIYSEHLSSSLKFHPTLNEINLVFFRNDLQNTVIVNKLDYEIPVGAYTKIEYLLDSFHAFSEREELNINVKNLYDFDKSKAQLISTRRGLISYPLRNEEAELESIVISFEACSETSAYDNEYKSDISVFINDLELLTYRCPGDFGGRHGLLNPDWYISFYTQFGELNTIHVNERGVYRNGVLVNAKVTIKDLDLKRPNPVLKIGNKRDCTYPGGINLFGPKFGDYPQGIKITYQTKKNH
ncbi:MAG: helix-turn-helix domain-containing protein [Bacilli bacterium]|nr:helix-turn-helix domain-containing protein [Bacilli bacterium]